jgi:hypothetical protein
MHRRILIALAAMAAGGAGAQDGVRADPTAPQAKVPPVEYRSAFEGYRPFAEEKVAPWRQSNEEVKESGGHAGDASKPPARQKPAAKRPADARHGGHR